MKKIFQKLIIYFCLVFFVFPNFATAAELTESSTNKILTTTEAQALGSTETNNPTGTVGQAQSSMGGNLTVQSTGYSTVYWSKFEEELTDFLYNWRGLAGGCERGGKQTCLTQKIIVETMHYLRDENRDGNFSDSYFNITEPLARRQWLLRPTCNLAKGITTSCHPKNKMYHRFVLKKRVMLFEEQVASKWQIGGSASANPDFNASFAKYFNYYGMYDPAKKTYQEVKTGDNALREIAFNKECTTYTDCVASAAGNMSWYKLQPKKNLTSSETDLVYNNARMAPFINHKNEVCADQTVLYGKNNVSLHTLGWCTVNDGPGGKSEFTTLMDTVSGQFDLLVQAQKQKITPVEANRQARAQIATCWFNILSFGIGSVDAAASCGAKAVVAKTAQEVTTKIQASQPVIEHIMPDVDIGLLELGTRPVVRVDGTMKDNIMQYSSKSLVTNIGPYEVHIDQVREALTASISSFQNFYLTTRKHLPANMADELESIFRERFFWMNDDNLSLFEAMVDNTDLTMNPDFGFVSKIIDSKTNTLVGFRINIADHAAGAETYSVHTSSGASARLSAYNNPVLEFLLYSWARNTNILKNQRINPVPNNSLAVRKIGEALAAEGYTRFGEDIILDPMILQVAKKLAQKLGLPERDGWNYLRGQYLNSADLHSLDAKMGPGFWDGFQPKYKAYKEAEMAFWNKEGPRMVELGAWEKISNDLINFIQSR